MACRQERIAETRMEGTGVRYSMMGRYDFDQIIDRRGSNCIKYDFMAEHGMPDHILPLWVADMDFAAPGEVVEGLVQAARHGIFGYSEAGDSYFQAVHDWMLTRHNWQVEREWLVKSPGIVFAIATAVRAFTCQGDGVMIQNPVYHPFSHVVKANDRTMVDNSLVWKNGRYTMDFDRMEQQMKESNVKLFILCNPHNPVGRVWTREELRSLGETCARHGVKIVSDEIHHDFIFPGHSHIVLAGMEERFAQMTVTCTAPSKTFNIAGLQVSNIFIPNPEMREAFRKELEKTGAGEINRMGLVAGEKAYRYGRQWLEELLVYLKGNLDFVRDFLRERLPGIRLVEPEGTYLLWLDFKGLHLTGDALEEWLVQKAGLWLNDGRMFGTGGEGYARLNMGCPRKTLEEALGRMEAALGSVL